MSKITRRTLLTQSPAALALAAIPASAAVAALPAKAAPIENPELIAAYDRFLAARAEVAAAEDALEWLIDEWRHRWPSAPEEILGGANADYGAGNWGATAERDIAGRFIRRDTAGLTKRMTRKMRERIPCTCFSVETPERIEDVIRAWERPRSGRTKAALARNTAEQQRVLAKFRAKLPLSRAYYAETAAIREASGVDLVKERVSDAKYQVLLASAAVSNAPATSLDGLRMKAEVLKADDLMALVITHDGSLGDVARFIDATLDVIGRVSA